MNIISLMNKEFYSFYPNDIAEKAIKNALEYINNFGNEKAINILSLNLLNEFNRMLEQDDLNFNDDLLDDLKSSDFFPFLKHNFDVLSLKKDYDWSSIKSIHISCYDGGIGFEWQHWDEYLDISYIETKYFLHHYDEKDHDRPLYEEWHYKSFGNNVRKAKNKLLDELRNLLKEDVVSYCGCECSLVKIAFTFDDGVHFIVECSGPLADLDKNPKLYKAIMNLIPRLEKKPRFLEY